MNNDYNGEGNFKEGYFFNPTKGDLTFEQTIEEIFAYMDKAPKSEYEIVVGCDSASLEYPRFPATIVVRRLGAGGRFFLKQINYGNRKFYNFKQRILQEVALSCELALELRDALELRRLLAPRNLKWEFCHIHADVGERGATREMVREVTGLIRGNGFEPMIKPFSFAASAIADKYT
jgi:predicted RNase H-related nuclease YkuK (DUF458 family)